MISKLCNTVALLGAVACTERASEVPSCPTTDNQEKATRIEFASAKTAAAAITILSPPRYPSVRTRDSVLIELYGDSLPRVLLTVAADDNPSSLAAALMYAKMRFPLDPLKELLGRPETEIRPGVYIFEAVGLLEAPPDGAQSGQHFVVSSARKAYVCQMAQRWLTNSNNDSVGTALSVLINLLRDEGKRGSRTAAAFLKDPTLGESIRRLTANGFL